MQIVRLEDEAEPAATPTNTSSEAPFSSAPTLVDQYPGSTPDLLHTLFRALYERVVDSEVPLLLRVIIAEGQRFPEIPAFHRETMAKAQALLTKILERGIARGEFRRGPVLAAPIVLVAPAIVAALWRLTFEPVQPLDTDGMLEAHADLVFRGLSTEDRR